MKHNWEYKKLGDVCVSELGKTLNQSKDTGSLQPYLCAVNVQWDSLDFTTLKQARFEEDELERYSVQKNDLLVCEGGDVGRAAIWNQEKPMLYQNALHRLRFSNNCNPRFYLFCFKHLKNKGVLDGRYAKGVTIKHLVKSALLSIQVPIPPLEEQSRIVAELDLLTGIIDKQNAQLKELDNLAQAIFYDMFGDPIENPKGWNISHFSDICEVTSSKRVYQSEWQSSGIPFLRISDFSQLTESNDDIDAELFISKEKYDELKLNDQVPSAGDILVTARGTLGVCYIVKKKDCFYFQDGMITWLKNLDERVLSQFVVFLFKNHSFRRQIDKSQSGSTVAYLSISMLKKFVLPVPPLTLQQSFAEKIQSIEKQKESIRASIADTQKLLDYTMDKYFG